MELQIKRRCWGWLGHSAQTNYQHHQAGLEMEPTGEVEEREAEELLVTINGVGDERGRLQLITGGETVTRQRGMQGSKLTFSFRSQLATNGKLLVANLFYI